MGIYLDVTEIFVFGNNSGIQRVVRQLVLHLHCESEGANLLAKPVVAIGGRFHLLSPAGIDALLAGSGGRVQSSRSPLREGRLRSALRYMPIVIETVRRLKFARNIRQRKEWIDAKPLALFQSDTLILIDSFWSGGSALSAAKHARRRGVFVAIVIYDLIPITHPKLVSRELAYTFPRTLRAGLKIAHGVLTISRSGTRELLTYAHDRSQEVQVRHFYLGNDIGDQVAADHIDGLELQRPTAAVGSGQYLMVGTIEPRKGHDYVLTAFETLWESGGQQSLLVIGKIGWYSERFIDRCNNSLYLGKNLFLVHDASDHALSTALQQSDALIMASSLEGFGLPLVEAFAAKLPVIASDIEVFKEIAGESALFFQCNSPDSLIRAIHSFERDPLRYRTAARDFRWPNWKTATEGFLAALKELQCTCCKVLP